LLSIRDNVALFSIIGTQYGGDGTTTFALPDLRGSVPVGVNANQAIGKVGSIGSGTGQPTLAIRYLICVDGIFPPRE
jgi:microcystin-dependent protein